MFDDGAERQSGEKTECADKQCGPRSSAPNGNPSEGMVPELFGRPRWDQ